MPASGARYPSLYAVAASRVGAQIDLLERACALCAWRVDHSVGATIG